MAQRTRSSLMPSERMKAYTDGVFAIAATLLVLDLTAESLGQVDSDGEMWAALADIWPRVFSFALSFVLLGGLWMVHLRQFGDIARVDGPLLWLNNARLLFVVLVPFATSVTDGYQDFSAGRLLLPVNFFLAALFGYLSWLWAARRGGILLADDRKAGSHRQSLGGLAAIVCGAITVAAAPFLGSFAFLAYLLNVPMTALLTAVDARRQGDPPRRG